MLLIAQDVLLHRYASKIKFSDKTRTHTHTPIYTIIHKCTHTHTTETFSLEVQQKFSPSFVIIVIKMTKI